MKRLLSTAAFAAAMCSGGAAQAALLDFNNPGLIDIDNDTGVATYVEAGYAVMGPATSFLPLDSALVGGFDDTAFTLSLGGGSLFTLQSLDVAGYDLGFGPGMLTVSGKVGATEVASRTFDLSTAASVSFDASWANLTSVSFSGTGGFALDNISAVPEPSGYLLMAAGLALVAGVVRRRR